MISFKKLLDTNNVAGIAIIHKGRNVLLIQKSNKDKWEIPKGHVRHGEDTFDGAVRETYEETKIMVDTNEWLDEVHKGKSKDGGDFTIYRYDVDEELVPVLSDEHRNWKYI